jgi:hypothetical protein
MVKDKANPVTGHGGPQGCETLRVPHFVIIIIISGVGLSPLGTAATSGLLYKPQMTDEDDCGAIGGINIDRGNRSTRRKPAPAPLCPPQIPHDQTRAWTPGRRGGKPATNRLSYGAAFWVPHYLDNRLTDGCKVVSLTRRPPFTPRKIPGTHFC